MDAGLKYSLRLLMALALLGLADCSSGGPSASSANSKVRGVSQDEIVIGSWGPQTGPAALWGSVNRGTETFFKMINDEGGINGRKVRFVYRDDGYQPQRTKAAVKEMVEAEGVFAFVGGVGTAPGLAVKDYIIDMKVPWVSPSSGSSAWAYPPSENIFATNPLYFDEAAVLVDYSLDTLGQNKIGFLYQNDDYGKAGLIGAQLAMEQRGLQLIAAVSSEVGDTDLTSQILALREAGAEVVITWILPKQAQILLSNATKLGFTPQWMTSSTLADYGLMSDITQGRWEGMIFPSFIMLDESDPLIAKYKAAQEKFAPQEHWGLFFASGYFYAEPLAEALRRCGNELTYKRLIHELEHLDGYAGCSSPLSFGPENRQGRRSVRLYRCSGSNTVESLSDWTASQIDIQAAISRLKKGS